MDPVSGVASVLTILNFILKILMGKGSNRRRATTRAYRRRLKTRVYACPKFDFLEDLDDDANPSANRSECDIGEVRLVENPKDWPHESDVEESNTIRPRVFQSPRCRLVVTRDNRCAAFQNGR